MTPKDFLKFRICATAIVTFMVWGLLIWDYCHEGVPSHHLLQRKDLPEFSNWLGGFLIPLLTWFLLYRIQKRISNGAAVFKLPSQVLYSFTSALVFGILLSVFFTLEYTQLPFYMMVSLLILALFLPIYRAECFLGFILGMVVTFGGVLPVLIISILSFIGAVLYLVIRPALRFIISGIIHLLYQKKRKGEN